MASPYFFSFWDRRLLFIIIACEKLAAKIAAIQREKEDKKYRAKRISLFMRMLAGQEECLRGSSWSGWSSGGRRRTFSLGSC